MFAILFQIYANSAGDTAQNDRREQATEFLINAGQLIFRGIEYGYVFADGVQEFLSALHLDG